MKKLLSVLLSIIIVMTMTVYGASALDDSAMTELFYQRMVISHVRQEVHRRVIIYINIVIAVEEITCVEQTA